MEKKDSKKLYAMKYMAKDICIQSGSIKNVIRELEMLKRLSHVFIVNLWFSFQDDEDLFIVLDLMLGGDLRHHLSQSFFFFISVLLLNYTLLLIFCRGSLF